MAVWLTGCHSPAEDTPAPRPVWVMTVGETEQRSQPSYTGEVKARYVSQIGFRIGGKIIARHVNTGDQVSKGQRIAQLDASDTRLNVQAAQADVQAAQSNLSLAEAELARRLQLYRQQFISKSALDSYETQVSTAQARLQQAQSQASLSHHQTGYTTLVAVRAGVIGMVNAEPGQVVAAGQPIADIYDLHTLEIEVAVPETLISQLQAGDAAMVTLGEAPQSYPGRIREIAPAANSQTHAFDLRVQLLTADSRFKPGMTARVHLTLAQHSQSLTVPVTAVTSQGQQAAVWVIDAQQRARLRNVKTGPVSEAGVPILDGLQAGERIATIGTHTLTEGLLVQPVQPGPEVLH